jgi:hypothetical protein
MCKLRNEEINVLINNVLIKSGNNNRKPISEGISRSNPEK